MIFVCLLGGQPRTELLLKLLALNVLLFVINYSYDNDYKTQSHLLNLTSQKRLATYVATYVSLNPHLIASKMHLRIHRMMVSCFYIKSPFGAF